MQTRKKKDPRAASRDARTPAVITPLHRAVVAACMVYAAARIVFAYAGGGLSRTWGIDAASYLASRADIVLALALPFVLLLPGVNAWFAGLLTRRPAGTLARGRTAVAAACTGLAVLAAYMLRIPFPCLGDAPYYLGDAYRIALNGDAVTGMVKPMAWLTGHLVVLLIGIGGTGDIALPFVIMGMAGAAILVWTLFTALRRERAPVALLAGGTLVCASATLMFFGYLELYAISYALAAAYFLLAWSAVRHGTGVIAPGVVLAVSLAFGLSNIVFVPSWIVLLMWRQQSAPLGIGFRKSALVLSLAMAAGFAGMLVLIDATHRSAPVLPLFPALMTGDDGRSLGMLHYTLLSAAHIADVLNVLVLDLGVLAAVLIVVPAAGWRHIDRRDPMLAVLGTAAVGGAPVWLAGQTYFGLARDWDLTTTPVLPLAFLAVWLLVSLHERRLLDLARLTPLVLAIALSTGYVWVRVNLDAPASAHRFEHLVLQNSGKVIPLETYAALEHLRKYYQGSGDEAKHAAIIRAMIETEHDPVESCRRLFIALMIAHDASIRTEGVPWLVTRLAGYAQHIDALSHSEYGDVRDYEEFATRAIIGARQMGFPGESDRGAALISSARPGWRGAALVRAFTDTTMPAAETAALLRQAVDAGTRDGELLVIAAGLYQQKGYDDDAIACLERALTRQPVHYPRWYLALAGMYHERPGAGAKERDVLGRCVANCAGTPEAAEAQRLLDQAP